MTACERVAVGALKLTHGLHSLSRLRCRRMDSIEIEIDIEGGGAVGA